MSRKERGAPVIENTAIEEFRLTNEALAAMAVEVAAEDGPGSSGWDRAASITGQVNDAVIAELRANAGKLPEGLALGPHLILTTTGATSGLPRVVPLGYFEVDDRLLVMATMGGSVRNPPWCYNLLANPQVQVELDGESFAARAEEITGADREQIYGPISDAAPHFRRIQERVDRIVPVIELIRQ